jgi:hypothetical protein
MVEGYKSKTTSGTGLKIEPLSGPEGLRSQEVMKRVILRATKPGYYPFMYEQQVCVILT